VEAEVGVLIEAAMVGLGENKIPEFLEYAKQFKKTQYIAKGGYSEHEPGRIPIDRPLNIHC
jgi:hypothetical protein